MTMPTESARNRRMSQGSPDCGPDALARGKVTWDFNDQSVEMPKPPYPWSEPVERETWRASIADYWADVRPVVLCAGFVVTVLAFGGHLAGVWGQ